MLLCAGGEIKGWGENVRWMEEFRFETEEEAEVGPSGDHTLPSGDYALTSSDDALNQRA